MPPQPAPPALRSAERLRALEAVDLVPGASDPLFEPFARLAARLLGVPVSLVSFVTDDRQVFAGSVGLAEPWASRRETPLELSYCQHVVIDDHPLVVSDSATDERFATHPATDVLGVRAYLGLPLRAPGGEPLGSLCAIDTRPRPWSPRDVEVLGDLATAVAAAIALRTSERAQRRVAHEASHRLRTPITALRLESEELAAGGVDTSALDRHLDDLEAVADDLVALAEEAGNLATTEVDLAAIVADAAAGGDVEVQVGVPVRVRLDGRVLRRLVELLLRHASTALVVVDAGAPRLRLDAGRGGGDDDALVDELAARLRARVVRTQDRTELLLPPSSLVD